MSPAAIDPKAAALAVCALSGLVLLTLVAIPRPASTRPASTGTAAPGVPGIATVGERIAYLRSEIARIDGLPCPVDDDLATRATYADELRRLGRGR